MRGKHIVDLVQLTPEAIGPTGRLLPFLEEAVASSLEKIRPNVVQAARSPRRGQSPGLGFRPRKSPGATTTTAAARRAAAGSSAHLGCGHAERAERMPNTAVRNVGTLPTWSASAALGNCIRAACHRAESRERLAPTPGPCGAGSDCPTGADRSFQQASLRTRPRVWTRRLKH